MISLGAGLPGIRAVVIIMSTSLHWSLNNSNSALIYSSLIVFAYPPAPEPSSSISTVRNSPLKLSTCSFTSGLVSNALTIAPRLVAVPIADNPATPAPIMSIFAGGILPAAVI